jgi:hypothetical protein
MIIFINMLCGVHICEFTWAEHSELMVIRVPALCCGRYLDTVHQFSRVSTHMEKSSELCVLLLISYGVFLSFSHFIIYFMLFSLGQQFLMVAIKCAWI